ncbi:hypothetical protein [Pantoea allii]|uniref:hypothetical protein n=1 Tax=Pantoea allii TaxID=574096 RepID=UPI001F4E55A0|nr:hypothetical protein [Pantoea allii]MCH9297904.1 hypothetical protein [Pantoea allii]
MNMAFLTEVPFLIGVIITVCVTGLALSMLKPDKSQLKGIKNWISRDNWSGEVITVNAESWYQNDVRYGDDFFYTFYFIATINGVKKRYDAMCVLNFSQIHKIREGVKISVKYSRDEPPKMAVVNLEYL